MPFYDKSYFFWLYFILIVCLQVVHWVFLTFQHQLMTLSWLFVEHLNTYWKLLYLNIFRMFSDFNSLCFLKYSNTINEMVHWVKVMLTVMVMVLYKLSAGGLFISLLRHKRFKLDVQSKPSYCWTYTVCFHDTLYDETKLHPRPPVYYTVRTALPVTLQLWSPQHKN